SMLIDRHKMSVPPVNNSRFSLQVIISFCFFNDTATTEIYTLSLHDALPILEPPAALAIVKDGAQGSGRRAREDRKSTRLNSSHITISYAVFCLKKKTKN